MNKISIMFSQEQISKIVEELAQTLSKEYEGKSVLVISVLTGAFIFTADLIRL